MDVAVVYESMFGNTHAIAEAIAEGVRDADPGGRVVVVPVAEAKTGDIRKADLLIVGGPTHLRAMTTGVSRRKGLAAGHEAARGEAEEPGPEPGAAGPGVRDWFEALPRAPRGGRAAAFDTRADVRFAGGAARGIARRLRGHGYLLAAQPEGFVVEGTEGPLREGERARARAWAAALVARQPRVQGTMPG